MNDSNYGANCTPTSLPLWDLENFDRLIFVAQSVQDGCGPLYADLHRLTACRITKQDEDKRHVPEILRCYHHQLTPKEDGILISH
jgi:hypothetical protein